MDKHLYGIVGYPLGHTLSPALHNWAFAQLGLPGCYFSWEITPQALERFMVAFSTLPIQGCSVTIPFKQRILPYVHKLTSEAQDIGAVNTLFWRQGQLWGDNSDCTGIVKSLEDIGQRKRFHTALLLGAGGVAQAAVWALKSVGVKDIILAVRNIDRRRCLISKWGVRLISWEKRANIRADLLINATPLGMYGKWQDISPFPVELLNKFQVVFDLIYNPIQTRLLMAAEKAGCETINGLSLFIAQAQAQFEMWTKQVFSFQKAFQFLQDILSRSR